MLLDAIAGANLEQKGGSTPVLMASHYGHVECIRLLVERRADVNKVIDTGTTPIHIASQNDLVGTVRALLAGGADSAVHRGTERSQRHSDTVQMLIKGGADVNVARNDLTTPVWIAACNGYVGVL